MEVDKILTHRTIKFFHLKYCFIQILSMKCLSVNFYQTSCIIVVWIEFFNFLCVRALEQMWDSNKPNTLLESLGVAHWVNRSININYHITLDRCVTLLDYPHFRLIWLFWRLTETGWLKRFRSPNSLLCTDYTSEIRKRFFWANKKFSKYFFTGSLSWSGPENHRFVHIIEELWVRITYTCY